MGIAIGVADVSGSQIRSRVRKPPRDWPMEVFRAAHRRRDALRNIDDCSLDQKSGIARYSVNRFGACLPVPPGHKP